MREIQAKKERLNFGKESAVRIPLDMARNISINLIFKIKNLQFYPLMPLLIISIQGYKMNSTDIAD